MMLTNLADILRGAGLPVVEADGWKTRSADGNAFVGVRSIICHWTATNPAARGDYPTWNTILNGNGSTPGPLSQLGLGRGGTWYTFAAGVAWHAGVVDTPDHNNYHGIGIEAEYHPDQGAWPDVQQRSYERGCAALARAFNVPVSQIQGHYEVARPLGRKSDPTTLPGGMPGFRQRVSAIINNPNQEDDVSVADVTEGLFESRDQGRNLFDWAKQIRTDMNMHAADTKKYVDERLTAIQLGGVNYDLLADKVADRLAARLAQ